MQIDCKGTRILTSQATSLSALNRHNCRSACKFLLLFIQSQTVIGYCILHRILANILHHGEAEKMKKKYPLDSNSG